MKTKDIRLRWAPDQAADARCHACSVCGRGRQRSGVYAQQCSACRARCPL